MMKMKKRLATALLCMVVATQAACAANGLSQAAISGDLAAVQQRVKAGDKINQVDKWGWTPLIWSVYYGNTPVTLWLLDHGADPNARTQSEYGTVLPGTTALILAAYYGRDDAVKALLAKKADAGVVDRKGKKAIDYAKEYEFDKCVALLKGK